MTNILQIFEKKSLTLQRLKIYQPAKRLKEEKKKKKEKKSAHKPNEDRSVDATSSIEKKKKIGKLMTIQVKDYFTFFVNYKF